MARAYRVRRSRPVGRTTVPARSPFVQSTPLRVYEAVIDHPCSWCGATIRAGELLTRQRPRVHLQRDDAARAGPGPVCRACAPFADPPL